MSISVQKPTDAQRQAILYLEVVALLHDIGKFSDSFLRNHAGDGPRSRESRDYNYELRTNITAIFPDLTNHTSVPDQFKRMWVYANDQQKQGLYDTRDLTGLLQQHKLVGWDGETYGLAELVLLAGQWAHRKPWQSLLGRSMEPAQIIGRLHGAAHYEKPAQAGSGKRVTRPHTDLCRATPFGHEELVWGKLDTYLQQLPVQDLSQVSDPKKRYTWLAQMRALLDKGIADTQLSVNDVTLWDWGCTVAALTKAAAYAVFQNGWPDNIDQLTFRTLSIYADRLELYKRSDKISDLLGIGKAVDESMEAVRQLLEVEYAIGNRIYHDHTGAHFLLPHVTNVAELTAEIQSLFADDYKPQVHLGQVVTIDDLDLNKRSAPEVVARQRQAIANMLTEPRNRAQAIATQPIDSANNLYIDEAMWAEQRENNAELCTVCRTRPVGYPPDSYNEQLLRQNGYQKSDSWATPQKAKERNICRICLFRRGRRSENWLRTGMGGTIWADEVTDETGRLALITGSLVLEEWLNGSLVTTLRDGKPGQTMAGKNASPARLFRIAETARRFWETVTEQLTPATIAQRPFRLALHLATGQQLNLGHAHAYELDWGEMVLGVVYDKDNNRFITAENLVYAIKRWPGEWDEIDSEAALQAVLTRKWSRSGAVVREPSQYLRPGQEITEVAIGEVEPLPAYDPFISLLAEPGLGMVVVPAVEALTLVEAIQQQYLTEMGRVADRLPLHLGIVYFPRRTPLTAVLDAGRRFLDNMPSTWEAWTVTERTGWTVTVARNGQTMTHTYPEKMGDGNVPDRYYPYLLVTDPVQLTLTDEPDLKHITDLTAGDTVYWRPGRFDFEFLDTVGRRFEIHYETSSGKRQARPSRPFLLRDLERLHGLWQRMCWLGVTQRHQVIFAVEATREAWFGTDTAASRQDPIFARFVADTLAGAAWPKRVRQSASFKEDLALLTTAGVAGELADLAELHMEIMKNHEYEKEAAVV